MMRYKKASVKEVNRTKKRTMTEKISYDKIKTIPDAEEDDSGFISKRLSIGIYAPNNKLKVY